MIGLYNLEPYLNVAIEKLRMYYGEDAEDYMPLMAGKYERVYASSIFTYTDKSYVMPGMICGGTGFNVHSKLPPEIEAMKPKINIGFTSRGCIRKCAFCVVPDKEGPVRPTGDIYDFWDGQATELRILDNNILALPEHFEKICNQIRENNLRVDFVSGFDIRLITRALAKMISRLRISDSNTVRFSFDNMEDENAVVKGIRLLKHFVKPRYLLCYVLIGFNTTEAQDLYRVEKLRSMGVSPFAMRYNNSNDEYLVNFARWVNRKEIFKSTTWADYNTSIRTPRR